MEGQACIGKTGFKSERIVERDGSVSIDTIDLGEWSFESGIQIGFAPSPPTFTFTKYDHPLIPVVEFKAIT